MNDQTSIDSPLTKEVKLKYNMGRGVKEDREPKHKGGIVLCLGCLENTTLAALAGGPELRDGNGTLSKQDS